MGERGPGESPDRCGDQQSRFCLTPRLPGAAQYVLNTKAPVHPGFHETEAFDCRHNGCL